MRLKRTSSWEEIFQAWEANESQNPAWLHVATEVKGWPDWKSWRMFSANQLKLPQRVWQLFAFEDPMEEIPAMLVGPWAAWQARLPASNVHSFNDLVRIPEQYQQFASNKNIRGMIADFPADAMMVALQKPDGRLVLIEGHHRAIAVAIAKHENRKIDFRAPIQIGVAQLDAAEQTLLDQVLTRGLSQEPPKG